MSNQDEKRAAPEGTDFDRQPDEGAGGEATQYDVIAHMLSVKLQLERVLERISDAFVALDADWNYTYVNEKAGAVFNREPTDLVGKHIWTEFPEGVGQVFYQNYYAAMETQEPRFIEEYYPPYERWFENRIFPSPDGLTIFFQDVTERHEREAELNRLNVVLRVLAACNHALIRATDEQTLLDTICQVCVELGGRRLVWVGYAEHDTKRTVRPVASAGEEADFLARADIRWSDEEHGRGPTGEAIRTGETVLVCNASEDPRFAPWGEAVAQYGLASVVSLPLEVDGEIVGALTIYDDSPNAFHDSEVQVLEELADNLAYGLGVLRTPDRPATAE